MLSALDAALETRRPPPGLIHHSDRGAQHASRLYRERLSEYGIRGSMSRTGNRYHNAQVESFLKTLKHEEVYNRKRLHSAMATALGHSRLYAISTRR